MRSAAANPWSMLPLSMRMVLNNVVDISGSKRRVSRSQFARPPHAGARDLVGQQQDRLGDVPDDALRQTG